MPPRHPDRRSVDELVEELRDEAEDLAQDLKGIPAQETVCGEAAQALEEYGAALSQIAAGADDPKAVAAEALALAKPLLPIGDAPDTLRDLLKPRRT
ncbi:hypothetical protein CIW48_27160 [Methylobacterium sp. P1-11]|uniref:hypothetical protein n=1 Tax=Methylobacterium sp. P1-11 TaxID=2024616 RepID=UPI0011EDEED9|nr:hypothetical protein [Methylobacterium sp. P1-11]KAA0117883.1 hypothetical protein CIW48_27160 [Methylobacterium sp. P1-11]